MSPAAAGLTAHQLGCPPVQCMLTEHCSADSDAHCCTRLCKGLDSRGCLGPSEGAGLAMEARAQGDSLAPDLLQAANAA